MTDSCSIDEFFSNSSGDEGESSTNCSFGGLYCWSSIMFSIESIVCSVDLSSVFPFSGLFFGDMDVAVGFIFLRGFLIPLFDLVIVICTCILVLNSNRVFAGLSLFEKWSNSRGGVVSFSSARSSFNLNLLAFSFIYVLQVIYLLRSCLLPFGGCRSVVFYVFVIL